MEIRDDAVAHENHRKDETPEMSARSAVAELAVKYPAEELFEAFRVVLGERLLEIDLKDTADYTYDDWLEYFRHSTTARIAKSREALRHILPIEGFAAASRWIEIIQNPSKMDKLYQGRLKAQADADIMDVAVGDDDEAFYESLIRENVQQLNTSSISQQEVARLTQNINIFRKELREIRSHKPKKGTVLEQVLAKAAMPRKIEVPAKKRAAKSPAKATKTKKTTSTSSAKKTAPKRATKASGGKS